MFGDVYDWAGEPRRVDITKAEHTFHPVSMLPTAMTYCSEQMQQLADQPTPTRSTLITELSRILSDMNETHPFREGNGRTQRLMIAQLAQRCGQPLNWAAVRPAQNLHASKASGTDPSAFEPLIAAAMKRRAISATREAGVELGHRLDRGTGYSI